VRDRLSDRNQRSHQREADREAMYIREGWDEDRIQKDRNKRTARKIAAIAGGVAIGIIAYRLAFDSGNGADRGIDLAPLGVGDANDGNGFGVDIDPFNRNPSEWGNDDTANPGIQTIDNFDILPAYFDGDGVQIAGANLFGGIAVPELDGPDVLPDEIPDPNPDNTPEVPGGTTDQPPAEQPEQPAPSAAWQPEVVTVTPGDVYTSTLEGNIHRMGHQEVGDGFSGSAAHRTLDAVRARFGDDIFTVNGQPGTYAMGNGDLGIVSGGQGQWRTEEIERFIREEIVRQSAA
jgi:hypothetical protein